MSEFVRRLRGATQSAHADLERRLNLLEQAASLPGRRRLVQDFHALHEAAERTLGPWLADVPDLEFGARNRLSRLRADLAVLGVAAPAPLDEAPPADCTASALGAFYVLEGSTLGGRVLRRSLEDVEGLSFLDPYGEQTGARWRAVLAVLDRESRMAGAADIIVAAAVATFGWVAEVLCPKPQAT